MIIIENPPHRRWEIWSEIGGGLKNTNEKFDFLRPSNKSSTFVEFDRMKKFFCWIAEIGWLLKFCLKLIVNINYFWNHVFSVNSLITNSRHFWPSFSDNSEELTNLLNANDLTAQKLLAYWNIQDSIQSNGDKFATAYIYFLPPKAFKKTLPHFTVCSTLFFFLRLKK